MGMAALLMPRVFFQQTVTTIVEELGIRKTDALEGSSALRLLEVSLACRLDVS